MNLNCELIPADITHYECIQNLARFYVYDMSNQCGQTLSGWECPENGLFECVDLKKYLTKSEYRSYLIQVNQELAGFAFVGPAEVCPDCHWNIEEFFILGKFQRSGLGKQVAFDLFKRFSGRWSVGAIAENTRAINFWRTIICEYTYGDHDERYKSSADLIKPGYPDPYPMLIFTFDTDAHILTSTETIRAPLADDVASMVALSEVKRRDYEKAQPKFWKYAQGANHVQTEWFFSLLNNKSYLIQVAEKDGAVVGFIIGRLLDAPKVYAPGGLTLEVDDYCVIAPNLWWSVGKMLLERLQEQAKSRGAVQSVVVCGQHDEVKRRFLKCFGLSVATEWHVGAIR